MMFRGLFNQNRDCIDSTIIVLINNMALLGRIELYMKGSKEEKISGIIQDMEFPMEALKASSLFNLMSYSLSHSFIMIGFKR
jgi:hypothetical protein